MVTDEERLQTLLKIACLHNLSLDDLDDESRALDCQAFRDWSERFLRQTAQGGSEQTH